MSPPGGEANNRPKKHKFTGNKARRATKGYCPKAKKLRLPEGKRTRPSTKCVHDKKYGVEGGETVDSYWLQQEDRKIGERKHEMFI